MTRVFFTVLGIAVYLFIINWAFNHIDPWVAMGLFIIGIYIAAKQIFKTIKNN